MPNNSKLRRLIIFSILAVLFIITAGLIFSIPSVQESINRRLDFTFTYLRSIIQPLPSIPTPMDVPLPAQAALTTLPITPGPTINPTPTSLSLPPSAGLIPPLFDPLRDRQGWNNCGPATLALALRYYGWSGDQYTIARVVKPLEADRNVNAEELTGFVLDHTSNLKAVFRVGGDLDRLKQLIVAGFPVIIEEGFKVTEDFWVGDDRWTGHYLLLTGYDDSKGQFISQDVFLGAGHPVGYADLEANWQAFNHLYLLVYPADSETRIKGLLGEDWDASRNRQIALIAAQEQTSLDPKNAFAWFNVGSNLTFLDRFEEARNAFDHARQLGLPQRMLRYQFGPFVADLRSGHVDDLLAMTTAALKITPNSEEAWLWQGMGLLMKNDRSGARQAFLNALANRPGFTDAQKALDSLGTP